jgi:O-antigen ligase
MGRIALGLYFCSMIFSVLFFGAIHTWVYTIVFLGVMAASLLLLRGEVAIDGRNPHLRWVKTDLTPLFFLFFAYLILQMVPLPRGLLLAISPDAKIAGDMAQPAPTALNPDSLKNTWHALAPYTYPVRMSLIRWVVYGLFFFGLIRCLNSRKRIEAAIVVILLLGCFESLYGIIQTYSGYHRAWWFKLADRTTKELSGTYLNYNHFAGLMEMGIALAVAYAGALGVKHEGRHESWRIRRSFKKHFLGFFSERRRDIRQLLVVFAGGIMGLGLILSASRGGIIAMAGALFLMGLLFFFRKGERRKGRTILILFVITIIYATYAGLDYTIGRFSLFDRDMELRLVRAEGAIGLCKDYLATGVGMGNFRHAYGKYQDPQDRLLYVDYAHNDYAHFMAEAGVVGLLLLLAGIGWYATGTVRLWRQRSDSFAVCLGIAPFGAIFALAIHSISDYNLHRPANMLVLIAIIAIGYAALHLERQRHERMRYTHRLLPMRRGGLAFLIGGVVLILWCGLWTVRHFVAEAHCSTEINLTLNLKQNPPDNEALSAMAWDPGNASYPFKLALALMAERDRRMQWPEPDTAGWKRSHEPIIARLERAVRLNPMNPEYHVRMAWEYSYLFDRLDYLTRWLPLADVCMERASWFAGDWPQNPRLQYDMGNYWTMRSKTLAPDDTKGQVNWTRALWHYRKGMDLEMKKELPEEVKGFIKSFYTDEGHWQGLK